MSKHIVRTLRTAILVMMSAVTPAETEITSPGGRAAALTFMAPRPSCFANGYAGMKRFPEYAAMTGIHIEWEDVPESGWTKKLQPVLNAFDLPVSDAARYGKAGVLIPLSVRLRYEGDSRKWPDEEKNQFPGLAQTPTATP